MFDISAVQFVKNSLWMELEGNQWYQHGSSRGKGGKKTFLGKNFGKFLQNLRFLQVEISDNSYI